MNRSFLLLLGLLAASSSFSQQKCDSAGLQADKALLQNFWTAFKDAVNHKDKAKLASLCRFPFTCDYCILDSTKPKSAPYTKVTKTTFDRSQYKIFSANRLVKEINKHNLPQDLFIFQPYYNTVDKKCSYSFGYTEWDGSALRPGIQHFFDIQNVNGKFKIISSWTLP